MPTLFSRHSLKFAFSLSFPRRPSLLLSIGANVGVASQAGREIAPRLIRFATLLSGAAIQFNSGNPGAAKREKLPKRRNWRIEAATSEVY